MTRANVISSRGCRDVKLLPSYPLDEVFGQWETCVLVLVQDSVTCSNANAPWYTIHQIDIILLIDPADSKALFCCISSRDMGLCRIIACQHGYKPYPECDTGPATPDVAL